MISEATIERMRYELEHPEAMVKRLREEEEARGFISDTKKMFLEEGRYFEKELLEWRNNR